MAAAEQAQDLRQRVFSATGASITAALVVSPLDVVKTRMQAQANAIVSSRGNVDTLLERFAIAGCSPSCPRPSAATLAALCRGPDCAAYSSTLDGLSKIVSREGLPALWRGADAALLMAIPMVGVYLPLYDYLMGRMDSLGWYAPLAAGASSRTAAVLCTSPLELLRTRAQAHQSPRSAPSTALQDRQKFATVAGSSSTTHMPARPGLGSLRHAAAGLKGMGPLHSVRTLWTGVGATLARDVPFSAIYWGSLEPIRRSLLPSDQGATAGQILAANCCAGGLGGAAAAAITTPLDVVKTRVQLGGTEGSHAVVPALRQLAAEGGLRSLFTGVGPRMLRAGPACAIVLASYELLKTVPL